MKKCKTCIFFYFLITSPPVFSISYVEIVQEYNNNQARFHKYYAGRSYKGEGDVLTVSKSNFSPEFKILFQAKNALITCINVDGNTASSFNKGQQLDYEGIVSDVSGDQLVLSDCKFTPIEYTNRYRFIGKNQSIVEDTHTKLQWQRCSYGQTWNGETCAGKARELTWDKASELHYYGWRLPTKKELSSLVFCITGQPAFWVEESKDKHFMCEGDTDQSAIIFTAFPNTPNGRFWASLPDSNNPNGNCFVSFENGFSYGSFISLTGYVRLVKTPTYVNNNQNTLSCNDFSLEVYDPQEKLLENLEKLAQIVKMPDNYFCRYDIDIIESLCNGKNDFRELEHLIDYGYIDISTVEAVKMALGFPEVKINAQRTEAGLRYEKAYNKLQELGMCHGCVWQPASYYAEKPNSQCAKLVEKALAGDETSIKEIKTEPNYCKDKNTNNH